MDFSCLFGIVVPGVSSTIILMLLGVYPIYLSSVASLYFPILLPISLGILLGGFCFMKLTKFLLEHFYAPTFYAIIGFTIGSIFVLLPHFSSFLEAIIGILSCLLRLCFFFYVRKNKPYLIKSLHTIFVKILDKLFILWYNDYVT